MKPRRIAVILAAIYIAGCGRTPLSPPWQRLQGHWTHSIDNPREDVYPGTPRPLIYHEYFELSDSVAFKGTWTRVCPDGSVEKRSCQILGGADSDLMNIDNVVDPYPAVQDTREYNKGCYEFTVAPDGASFSAHPFKDPYRRFSARYVDDKTSP